MPFVVIYNPFVFTIDVVPFIFTHFANSWCLWVCLCLQLFWYLLPSLYWRDHVHPWINEVLQIYVLFVLIIIQCKRLLLALITIVLPWRIDFFTSTSPTSSSSSCWILSWIVYMIVHQIYSLHWMMFATNLSIANDNCYKGTLEDLYYISIYYR